ncbi:MAG: phosphotransferase [Pseudomonadota bacterium]
MAKDDLSSAVTDLPRELACGLERIGLSTQSLKQVRKGLTSKVWVHEPAVGPSIVLKLSDPNRGSDLFPNMPEQEWAAMKALSGRAMSAFPLTLQRLPSGKSLILSQFISSKTTVTPRALAELLHKIHGTHPWTGLTNRMSSTTELLAEGHALLVESSSPVWLTRLAPPDHRRRNLTPQCLVHRDPVPANVAMNTESHAVALDWQCPAFGDPCEDIAHATSPGMQSLSETDPVISDQELLDAYRTAEMSRAFAQMAPYYRWRMACYCHWQLARGNPIYAVALERECAALEEARERADRAG